MSGEFLGAASDQEPEYQLETLTGPAFDDHLLALVLRSVNTLSVSGYRLVCMTSRSVNPETNIVTVECRDEERHSHRLTYSLEPDSPIEHEMLKDRPDPRTEYP